ncbi:nuclear transport factor 2 family protein [Micromonospora echinofusca]|uniref:SnoaL-like domain-containing protein n=1 Tax=Micromonospora echinofusca TaxID=47858 RepID=A0ABS3VTQ4_MICEH|nr:nuclear transport factor 2 family protein [Micromonospora echinofusca]MBO4207823.1 hypothetical protein [Micromonospora echinofusca]
MIPDAEPTHPNLLTIERFLGAYSRRDRAGMQDMATLDVQWRFPGPPPLGGQWHGVDGIMAFLDAICALGLQERSHVRGVSDEFVVECKETVRDGGSGMLWCVLWAFRGGRISAGTHLTAEPDRVRDPARW